MTGRESLMAFLRCSLGWHSWDKLPTSRWLDKPLPHENRLGSVIEYRGCLHCAAITDASAFFSTVDPELGVPNWLGPLASERFREVLAMPYRPLPATPLPLDAFDE